MYENHNFEKTSSTNAHKGTPPSRPILYQLSLPPGPKLLMWLNSSSLLFNQTKIKFTLASDFHLDTFMGVVQ